MSAIDKAIKLMCATCGNDLCNGNCWDVGGMRIIIAEAQIEALENFITNSISLGELRNSIKNMESVIDAEKANALANEMNRLRKAAVRGE